MHSIDDKIVREIVKQLSHRHKKHTRVGYLLGSIGKDTIKIEGVIVPEQTSSRDGTSIDIDLRERVLNQHREVIVGAVQYNPPPLSAHDYKPLPEMQAELASVGLPSSGMGVNSKREYQFYRIIDGKNVRA